MNVRILLTVAFILVFKNAYSQKDSSFLFTHLDSIQKEWIGRDSLVSFAYKYLNTPYKYSGCSPKGFDCSGFVTYILDSFQISLPRSSSDMAFMGKFVSAECSMPGDLIFFNGRYAGNETVGHVGIITKITNGEIFFIHSSSSNGVIISSAQEDYYAKRFVCIKRIPIIQN